MYKKLLISAGGGIISRDQQAQQDECATIAIGLGGTGISCLRALKKEVYTRVQPDVGDTMVARYKHIKFLAVDTDKSSIGDNGSVDSIDSNTEFFNISCPDITGLLSQEHLLLQNASLQWLKTQGTQGNGSGISILSAEAGAGGVRQVGRLLLLQNCTAFVSKLQNIIREARTDLMGNPNINIHIFTGISGGTGAGTFLDVCYILQHVLGQLGLAGQAYTCGYFFLPDVNIANGVDYDYLPINGFASMKELDYAMNYENNGGQWSQRYDGFEVVTTNPPVKLAHLITSTDANGAIRSNGYDYAMHVAVDYVLEYIIKPYVSDGDDTDNDGVFSIKSHIANINSLIGIVNKAHGACYNYCVLGAANAYLPYKDITTYLTSKIFEGFGKLVRQIPTDAEIDTFVHSNGLEYEDIFRDLLEKVPGIPNYPVDHKLLYEQTEGISSDSVPQVLTQMRNATSNVSGVLAQNKAALLNTGVAAANGSIRQILVLEVKVKEALIQIAGQADKGPYYAVGILHNTNARDLRSKISGYIQKNIDNLSLATGDLRLRDKNMATALRDLQNSNFINRKRAAEDYANAVHSYYVQKAKIEQFQVMGDVLKDFEAQVNSLYTSFFGIFEDVMKRLQDTFENNLKTLSTPVLDDNGYAMKLMTIQDLQESLDRSVAAMSIDDQIHDFVSMMFHRPEVWTAQDENKISEAVTSFFLRQLGDYTRRTLLYYLQVKFNTTDPTRLTGQIYDQVMLPLDERANPLFWTETGYNLSDAKTMGYLSIPNISDEIKAAALDYKTGKANNQISIRTSWSTDRITLFTFKCGVPMFGYKGVSNYKPAYKAKPIIGSHLYEGSVGDERDSRRLVDVSPLSRIREVDYTQEMRENIVIYNRAREVGVLSKVTVGNADEYHLNIVDGDAIQQWISQAETYLAKRDLINGQTHLAQLKEVPLPLKVGEFKQIRNTGFGNAELVIRDHTVDSQFYMRLLREQMAILDERTKVEAELEKMIRENIAAAAGMHTFTLALATGVIRKKNDYTYAFVDGSFGLDDETELTTIETEPYGMTLPLYSAFIGFNGLEVEDKEKINSFVKSQLVNHKDDVNKILNVLRDELKPDRINALISTARVSCPGEESNITSFFKRLVAEFNNFIATR